jgi:hypothetical protein
LNGRSHDRPFLNGQSCDRPVRRTNQPAALVFCMLEVHPTIRHQLFANTSRPAFGANPPSITGTTARHNLATSFTRALSEPKPNATQQLSPSRAHERASKRALHPIHNVKQPKNNRPDPKTRHRSLSISFLSSEVPIPGVKLVGVKLVELNGFEPMTPCLQSRCSPS